MAITSEDIQKQSFSIERKGYDIDQVDDFLEHVSVEIDALNTQVANLKSQLEQAQNACEDALSQATRVYAPLSDSPDEQDDPQELRARVLDLENKLAEKSANDTAISQALIVAQRSADDIVANARTQAKTIVEDAHDQASRIVTKAENDRQKVVESTQVLEDAREKTRGSYQQLLNDFITDASHKLAEIEADAPRRRLSSSAAKAPQVAAVTPDVVGQSHKIDAGTDATHDTPKANAASFVDKDFSGFGDADDDFDFDDPE